MAYQNPASESKSPPTNPDKIKSLDREHRLNHVDELLSEYPDIAKHIGDFRVRGTPETRHSTAQPRNLKDSIVVFKKKRLLQEDLQSNINIYECYSGNLELDLHDQRKSRTSCQRCRRYKKKCTRDLPECLNCASCEEMCYYTRRKKKTCSGPKVNNSPLSDTKVLAATYSEPESYLHRQENKIRRFKSESPRTHALYMLGRSSEHPSDVDSISSSIGSLTSETHSYSPKSSKSRSPTIPKFKESSIHWLLN